MVIVGTYEYWNFTLDSEGKPPEEREAAAVYCDILDEEWSFEWGRWFPQSYWFHPICPCIKDGDECYCTPVMAFDSVIWG